MICDNYFNGVITPATVKTLLTFIKFFSRLHLRTFKTPILKLNKKLMKLHSSKDTI